MEPDRSSVHDLVHFSVGICVRSYMYIGHWIHAVFLAEIFLGCCGLLLNGRETGNYRPIPVLPIFSKILEQIMNKQLVAFLDKYKIIYKHQYGFQKTKSTSLAILDLISKSFNRLKKAHSHVVCLLTLLKLLIQ